jgi:hypothetical protein
LAGGGWALRRNPIKPTEIAPIGRLTEDVR